MSCRVATNDSDLDRGVQGNLPRSLMYQTLSVKKTQEICSSSLLAALPSPISPTRRPALVSPPLSGHRHSSPPSNGFPTTCPWLPAVGQAGRCTQCACILGNKSLQRVSIQTPSIAVQCAVATVLCIAGSACAICTGLRLNQLHGRSFLSSASSRNDSLPRLKLSSRTPAIAQEGRPQLPLRPTNAARRVR